MRAWFDTFNRKYFNGELPLPRLALGNSRTRLGSMSCRRRRTLTGWRLSDFAIRLSTYYDCTEREMQTVLLHEMIHYYIAWKGIRDDAPHGSVFRSIMNRLNTRHGWDISVSASMRGRKTAAPHNDRRPRLVLALENSRGECFLTVVNPRYAAQLKSRLKNAADATQRAWFVSTDPFFSYFTTVRSLRARKVKREVFDEKIACGTMVDI